MLKLFNADILDIFPTEDGFVYASSETLKSGDKAVMFRTYNIKTDTFEKIPVNSYIISKYGEDGFIAARALEDFVTCRIEPYSRFRSIASYSDGDFRILDDVGNVIEQRNVEYNNNPACSPAVRGEDIWMVIPDANVVINYSLKHNRTEFRIGSPADKTFSHPCDLRIYDNRLYICNATSYKIKTLDFEDYNVRDYHTFSEPVYRYFRSSEHELVQLKSGVYVM